ncbi:MAG: DUF1587 domain-containing protein, partial [Pseudomonadales bacterium]|nr:DUF1587 domain-containing protein [Pseudomonadales bacterium]
MKKVCLPQHMYRRIALSLVVPALLGGIDDRLQAAPMSATEQRVLLDDYCAECHNLDDFAGGLAFDLLNPERLHEDPEIWEKVIRKLQARLMPPSGQARPEAEHIEAFATSLAGALDALALAAPNPGAPLLHRLNRSEYSNAIRDLLALPVDATELLPADDSSAGFDNIANVLSVSPALMQAYVSAAAKISRIAIGDLTISAGTSTYRPPAGVPQDVHREGLPLGTRGGLAVEHVFPLDADYELEVRRSGRNNFILPPTGLSEAIEVVIDGERVRVLAADAPGRFT